MTANFVDGDGNTLPPVTSRIAVGADGIKSVIRKQFYPDEGEPRYSGYTDLARRAALQALPQWREHDPGAGWMPVGKIMVYPIRNNIDERGQPADELGRDAGALRAPKVLDWNKPAKIRGFLRALPQLAFRLLDVPDMLQKTERPLIFPMVDAIRCRPGPSGVRRFLGGRRASDVSARVERGRAGRSSTPAVMTQALLRDGRDARSVAGL